MSAGAQARHPTDSDDVFITYLDQSDSFALGVEFGEFLSALGQGYEAVGGYFSARLEAQLLVAASRLGYVREEWVERADGSCLGRVRGETRGWGAGDGAGAGLNAPAAPP